ncbi:DUF951 domain-containing protein [Mammaliicoccus sciuri]|nr:DUF951 domain-containing protein [Mammaliicoccus sciuri]
MIKSYELNDIVEMKKQHACGYNRFFFFFFKIIRLGADVRIKCEECSRSIMLPRQEFNKKIKKY